MTIQKQSKKTNNNIELVPSAHFVLIFPRRLQKKTPQNRGDIYRTAWQLATNHGLLWSVHWGCILGNWRDVYQRENSCLHRQTHNARRPQSHSVIGSCQWALYISLILRQMLPRAVCIESGRLSHNSATFQQIYEPQQHATHTKIEAAASIIC